MREKRLIIGFRTGAMILFAAEAAARAQGSTGEPSGARADELGRYPDPDRAPNPAPVKGCRRKDWLQREGRRHRR